MFLALFVVVVCFKIYTELALLQEDMLGSLLTACGILFSMARKEEAPACLAPPHSDIKTYTLSDQPIARDLDFNQKLLQYTLF
jgi:hypothetical protein